MKLRLLLFPLFMIVVSPLVAGKPTAMRGGPEVIKKALSRPDTSQFEKAPLREVVEQLSASHQIPIFLDNRGLADNGISDRTPLTLEPGSRSLEEALAALFQNTQLQWLIHHDVLMITTSEEAKELLETKVYRLVQRISRPDAAITSIQTSVFPNTWSVVGGQGNIDAWPAGGFVITQTYGAHRQIESRYVNTMQAVPLAIRKAPRGASHSAKTLAMTSSCDFQETPLLEAAKQLGETHGITITVDRAALQYEGIKTDVPITLRLEGIRLESLLSLMLREYGLVWTPDSVQLLITTWGEAEKKLLTIKYDIRDLVIASGGDPDLLEEVIIEHIFPNTWKNVGGYGQIANVGPGTLAIQHNFRAHRRINHLLTQLRQLRTR